MTADELPPEPPRSFAETWQVKAPQVDAEGERLGVFLEQLGGRAHGALTLILGLLLLIPLKWVLPQIAGLLLLASGWRLFGGIAAPVLPFVGGRVISKARLAQWGGMFAGQTWLSAISKPRLADLTSGFALKAAAIALIVGGLAAIVPAAHLLLAIGLILLGLGLMQRDGAALLGGIAVSFAAAAFTLTLLAGAVAGAPFAAGWREENVPFLIPAEKPLVPEDHATR